MVLAFVGEENHPLTISSMPVDGQIFNRLLILPLFQGMSRSHLQEVVAHTRLGFSQHDEGTVIVRRGDRCTLQRFLVGGSLMAESESDTGDYSMREIITAPYLLQPERLFGLTQNYTYTFTAHSHCQILEISKDEMVRLCAKFDIFRTNLLNILTTQSQRAADEAWHEPARQLPEKIKRFIMSHSLQTSGDKWLHIKMETLARHIGESRLNVSQQLRQWERDGLIHLSRNNIYVLDGFEI